MKFVKKVNCIPQSVTNYANFQIQNTSFIKKLNRKPMSKSGREETIEEKDARETTKVLQKIMRKEIGKIRINTKTNNR